MGERGTQSISNEGDAATHIVTGALLRTDIRKHAKVLKNKRGDCSWSSSKASSIKKKSCEKVGKRPTENTTGRGKKTNSRVLRL